jgi:hypothetical protein
MPKVSVRVIDSATGRGIPYVFVSLDGVGGSTDANGQVALDVPPGNYTLSARAASYSPYTARMGITGDISLTIPLSRARFWY